MCIPLTNRVILMKSKPAYWYLSINQSIHAMGNLKGMGDMSVCMRACVYAKFDLDGLEGLV